MKRNIFYNDKNFECDLSINHDKPREFKIVLNIYELTRGNGNRLVFCPQDACSFYANVKTFKTRKKCEKELDDLTFLLNDNILHKIIDIMYANNIQVGYKYNITNILKGEV